jgi:PAS domain S-box-containing protein
MTGTISPKFKWYQSIRMRFFLVSAGLVAGLAAFILLYFPGRIRSQAHETVESQVKAVAGVVAFSVGSALDFDDPDAVMDALEGAKKQQDITYVSVKNTKKEELGVHGSPPASLVEGLSADQEQWTITAPVFYKQQNKPEKLVGELTLSYSLAEINKGITTSTRVISSISFIIFILGLGITYYASNVLTSNLRNIVNVADRIGSGETSMRADVRSQDELGVLAASFNSMLVRLEDSTEALKTSERQFRRLAQNMNEGLAEIGPDFKVRYANPRFLQMFNKSGEEVIGGSLRKAIGVSSVPNFFQDQLPAQIEIEVSQADESTRHLLLSHSIFKNEDAGESSVSIIFTDITTLKKTEKDLLYKNRELDTFVYKASHDLKAPLASLRGLVTIAQDEITGESAARYFPLIDRTITKMDDVLQGLLEVAWIKQGALDYQPIRLDDLLPTILRSIEHAPGFDTIRVDFDLPKRFEFASDPKILNSVLQNLIHNAIKYHREEGDDKFVKVIAQETPHHIVITVQDNGPGIPPAAQERLFDMFFRASNKSKGSGLGLYIVKNSIEKMGGTIKLQSEVGRGTEFIVRLPKVEVRNS